MNLVKKHTDEYECSKISVNATISNSLIVFNEIESFINENIVKCIILVSVRMTQLIS